MNRGNSTTVLVAMTAEEKQQYRQAATTASMSMTAWIRTVCSAAASQIIPPSPESPAKTTEQVVQFLHEYASTHPTECTRSEYGLVFLPSVIDPVLTQNQFHPPHKVWSALAKARRIRCEPRRLTCRATVFGRQQHVYLLFDDSSTPASAPSTPLAVRGSSSGVLNVVLSSAPTQTYTTLPIVGQPTVVPIDTSKAAKTALDALRRHWQEHPDRYIQLFDGDLDCIAFQTGEDATAGRLYQREPGDSLVQELGLPVTIWREFEAQGWLLSEPPLDGYLIRESVFAGT